MASTARNHGARYPASVTRKQGKQGSEWTLAYSGPCRTTHGNVTAKSATIAGVTATTRYSYNPADRLMEVHYPGNDADIVYARDADGRIASVSNSSTAIVTAIEVAQ
jgi:RHS Repeat